MNARPVQESATTRLQRLLTMVPWLLANQGVATERAAEQFGVSTDQLESDLALLFLCGTPGHLPDDLIEADWEDGRVFVGNADAIARPLRFTVDEALTLMVGLRALGAGAGLAAPDGVLGALTKLEAATGETAGLAARVRVDLPAERGGEMLARAQQALHQHRRIRLRYASARDEVTERDVDPMRLLNLDAHWYLEGWCHRAADVRVFRLDRVESLQLLDLDGTPPAHATSRDLATTPYQPGVADVVVELELEPSARWVAEYYPVESVKELPGDRRRVTVRAADPGWVRRLAWRLGGALVVTAPADLVAAIREQAHAALAAYPPQVRS